jgi:hypothetical protein
MTTNSNREHILPWWPLGESCRALFLAARGPPASFLSPASLLVRNTYSVVRRRSARTALGWALVVMARTLRTLRALLFCCLVCASSGIPGGSRSGPVQISGSQSFSSRSSDSALAAINVGVPKTASVKPGGHLPVFVSQGLVGGQGKEGGVLALEQRIKGQPGSIVEPSFPSSAPRAKYPWRENRGGCGPDMASFRWYALASSSVAFAFSFLPSMLGVVSALDAWS